MKNIALLFALPSLLLLACGGDQETAEEQQTAETANVEAHPVVADYLLVADKSSAKWERELDQKPTKQKVKLFGKMVDVELGEVKMNTNGTVSITEGGLTLTDKSPTSAHVVFDMASFGFAKEKDQGLFNVKEFPNSTLMLNDFADSTATGTITIQGVSKDVEVATTVSQQAENYLVAGSFVVNTLDFPLREQIKAKDVNKDQITVNFELTFELAD